jgi:ABC-type dipeptide/oligopeptide/nickel transport system ATPase component
MNIQLPPKVGEPHTSPLLEFNQIVIVGSNGSGKTRFGTNIEQRYPGITHRIAAQKSLSMPSEVSPKSRLKAESEFHYGYFYEQSSNLSLQEKFNNRWGRKPNTFLLNDYEKLLVLLHTEEYEDSLRYKEGEISKPTTKLDRIQNIWEAVLPHRKLIKRAGVIETYPTDQPHNKYNATEMSDGERVIFYLIGETVCAPPNCIIIIDEPEIHIHKSILKQLWDLIEKERPDCSFIYLTHDIDFAASRELATKIWLKGYQGFNTWDYEILNDDVSIPEQLYLEILGSRKPILFTEGDKSSIDYALYQLVFPEYTVTPLGNCNKVFEATKSFNELNQFHHLESKGIIDRDRRPDSDVNGIRDQGILVTDVAESESILMHEDIIRVVSKRMFKNEDEIVSAVKDNVIRSFGNNLFYQATQHSIFRIKNQLERGLNPKVKDFVGLDLEIRNFMAQLDYSKVYQDIEGEFKGYVDNKDYTSILKVYNNKGLITDSGMAQMCDLNSKNNGYLNFVIGILKERSADTEIVVHAIKSIIR